VFNFDTAVANVAMGCARQRAKGLCKHAFDSAACNQCKWYIKRYVNPAPNDALLFMMEADRKVEAQLENEAVMRYKVNDLKVAGRGVLIIILAVLAFFVVGIAWVNSPQERERRMQMFHEHNPPSRRAR